MSSLDLSLPLDQVPFVVVDTETTGTKAAANRLIEIGAVKVHGGEVVGTFEHLINPGSTVPRRITSITGISTGMVFDQPQASRVLPRFLDFLGDGVMVAHNLTFDLNFINAELARLGRGPLANPTLCTLRLARRLLPGLRSKGLTSLSAHYGITNKARHRALGDATATAEVLGHFLKLLDFHHEVDTLGELLRFQHRKYTELSKQPKYLERIRKETLPALPDRPGVYFMRDARDNIVYIGKAKSLRDRVRSYFTGIEGHPERTRKLVNTVRDITWEETGSELGALLLESKLIKQHVPRFNRALRRYRNRPFIRLDMAHEAPRLSFTSYLQDDGAEYFGPLGGRRQAELVLDVINHMYKLRECDDPTYQLGRRCLYADFGRCTAPCVEAGASAEYEAEVERVRAFLMGQDRSVLATLEAEMLQASAEQDFEQAREYRDWMQKLERLLDKQQRVAAPVLQHNAVIVQPAVEKGTAQLFLVRFGRLAETATIKVPPMPDEVTALAELLACHFDPAMERPARYFKKEVEEIRLLAHWMHVHRDSTGSVRWEPSREPEHFLDAVLQEATRALQEDIPSEVVHD